MIGVLGRAMVLLSVAPVSPVTWRPANRALPSPRRIVRLPDSGARVVAIPVESAHPAARQLDPGQLPAAVPDVRLRAPWGEPSVPFAGVIVTTSQVPVEWLQPPARPVTTATIIPIRPSRTAEPAVASATGARLGIGGSPVPRSPASPPAMIIQLPHPPRTLPPPPMSVAPRGGRFRRTMAFAVGLLVSMVAVEVAARSGRR